MKAVGKWTVQRKETAPAYEADAEATLLSTGAISTTQVLEAVAASPEIPSTTDAAITPPPPHLPLPSPEKWLDPGGQIHMLFTMTIVEYTERPGTPTLRIVFVNVDHTRRSMQSENGDPARYDCLFRNGFGGWFVRGRLQHYSHEWTVGREAAFRTTQEYREEMSTASMLQVRLLPLTREK